jgi:hydrogenase maturation protease
VSPRPIVIGVGNRYRGDDAAGPEVARSLAERAPELDAVEHELEPSGLIELWTGRDLAIVADATRPAGEPGRVHRLEIGAEPIPARVPATVSTHALDLAEAIELARSLDRLPDRLVVYAVEGASFETGAPLTPEVEAAVKSVVTAVLDEAGDTGQAVR